MNTTDAIQRETLEVLQPITACPRKGKVWEDSRPTVTSCPNQHAPTLSRENAPNDNNCISEADEGGQRGEERTFPTLQDGHGVLKAVVSFCSHAQLYITDTVFKRRGICSHAQLYITGTTLICSRTRERALTNRRIPCLNLSFYSSVSFARLYGNLCACAYKNLIAVRSNTKAWAKVVILWQPLPTLLWHYMTTSSSHVMSQKRGTTSSSHVMSDNLVH